VDPLLQQIHTWNLHPCFQLPSWEIGDAICFDLNAGVRAKESENPDTCFSRSLSDSPSWRDSIVIYTDRSRGILDDGNISVGSAIVVPELDMGLTFRLNPLSSSFSAETFAIDKAIELIMFNKWKSVTICTDSLSALTLIRRRTESPWSMRNRMLESLYHKYSL